MPQGSPERRDTAAAAAGAADGARTDAPAAAPVLASDGRRPMRILHTEASCGWGGQELRILTESTGLIARGHAVTLACPPHAVIAREALRHSVPLVTLPLEKKRVRGVRALRALLAERSFDVINTHSSTDSWLAALACASLSGAPPIVRTRHISTAIPRSLANRWLYMRANARIVTTGEAMRRSLATDYGFDLDRIVSVPTGIDIGRFRPGDRDAARQALRLAPRGFLIGIVATLRKAKGHHLLLDALAAMGNQAPELLIVGDGPQRPNLEAQVDRLDLRARVSFVGNQADVLPWLQALDAFVLPTLHEGVPQALAQAMAVGLPCITTPVGGIPEIAEGDRSALFIAPGRVEAIVEALNRIAGDAALRERLGGCAREAAVARCADAVMLDRMEALFRAVIDERGRRE
jgi:glycosyltransferase involved in cell wall biosynthesis